ncbi:MAG: flagellar biosynthesis protein FlhB [Pseudomonadota bacterium]
MAEQSGMERTERASPKRIQEARERGDIPRSRDLNTVLLMLAASGGLLAFGSAMAEGLARQMTAALTRPRDSLLDPAFLQPFLGEVLVEVLTAFLPFLLLLFLVALFAPMSLGGWSFSPKALALNFGKLDPVKGLGRIFSLRAPVEALKSFAKFLVVAVVCYFLLRQRAGELFMLGSEPLEAGLQHAAHVIGWSFVGMSSVLILIAAVDVPFQLWDHSNKLKMTKQEVKDEAKQTEGSPELKGRVRAVQRRMAQQRMMQDVPTADVVVTNPSHYAVALRYDQDKMGAPKVVASGADLIAAEIRRIAVASDVTIVEAPPLARALYFSTDIGEEIPAGLYIAVAQLLAYVYQLRAVRKTHVPAPAVPNEFPIPPELRRDA